MSKVLQHKQKLLLYVWLDTESGAGHQRYKHWLGSLPFDRSGRAHTVVHDDSCVILVSYPHGMHAR